ncbi:MAG: tetratricopeptide repeat protein [Planctomycetota bacterium]
MNFDESRHLPAAREISLRADSFYLPLESPTTNHALGVLYVTALADWLGGGSVFVIRLTFVALSLFGLIGLYLLAESMFGGRVALVALALAALDRSLVAMAPVFLEGPSATSLAPWAILLMHRCLLAGRGRDWLLLGLLMGLGYWLSTLFLVLLLPFGLCVLFTGRLGQVLSSRWMFAGLALMLAVVSPHIVSDLLGGSSNYNRNVHRVGAFGLSPRMALLYIGDLLICLKPPTWIFEEGGHKMYLPIYVPCDWVMGSVYIVAAVASLRFWRDQRVVLLLSVIVGFLIPVTLVAASEPWNEFTWASPTLFAAIVLTAFMADRALSRSIGRLMLPIMLAYSAGALSSYLVGPKWGYFSPDWERRFLGRVVALERRSRSNPAQYPRDPMAAQVRELTGRVIAQHPESVVAWYFWGFYADFATERTRAFDRVLRLEPGYPPAILAKADDRAREADWTGARRLLRPLASGDRLLTKVYRKLAEVEFELGNYTTSLAYARKLIDLTPQNRVFGSLLVLNYLAMGEPSNAEAALDDYVAADPDGPVGAYLTLVEMLWQEEQWEASREYVERAIRAGPRRAGHHADIGRFLAQLGEIDRAARHFDAALRAGAAEPGLFFNRGRCAESQGDTHRAVQCYQTAIELDPDFGEAHFRLGVLLSQLGRTAEATEHRRAAERLGFTPPATGGAPPPDR